MADPWESEVAALSAVDENDLVAALSYGTWRDAPGYPTIPAQYGETSDAFKWGNATPGTTATITYWFDTASDWSEDEQSAFEAAMGLWSAVANVTITEAGSAGSADFQIQRTIGSEGAVWNNVTFDHPEVGSATLGTLPQSAGNNIQIDTDYTGAITDLAANKGYAVSTLIHELGHMLGLGHGGPYDGRVDPMTQQFSAYDMRLWTLMSYIGPDEDAAFSGQYSVTGTQWGGYLPLTPMMLDILAVQRLYGTATSGPLTGGGHTFGFNSNIGGTISRFYDFTVNLHPIVTIWENGTGNTLDLSGYTTDSVIDLRPGSFSSAAGMTNNIGIAFGTVIETGIGGGGDDTIWASDVASRLFGGAGGDRLYGGAGDDVLSGGADPDTIDGGGGLNVLRDILADMDGDTVFHFGESTTIDVQDALIGRDHLTVTFDGSNTTLGLGDTRILLAGTFDGGDFMAVARSNGSGPHTDVTFETWLPQLFEGVAVETAAINGIANMPFLTGDGLVRFSATLEAAISAFANTLGWYRVATDGTIFGVDVLYADTLSPGAVTASLGAPGSGEKIGFFLVQNGFGQFGSLPDDLSFVTQGSLAPADLDAGLPLFLRSASLGVLTGATVFHSFATLNEGDAMQVLSGVAPGGRALEIGFEDMALGAGDNDFQDVVLSIFTDRNDVFWV
jgi:hypothetical protein